MTHHNTIQSNYLKIANHIVEHAWSRLRKLPVFGPANSQRMTKFVYMQLQQRERSLARLSPQPLSRVRHPCLAWATSSGQCDKGYGWPYTGGEGTGNRFLGSGPWSFSAGWAVILSFGDLLRLDWFLLFPVGVIGFDIFNHFRQTAESCIE